MKQLLIVISLVLAALLALPAAGKAQCNVNPAITRTVSGFLCPNTYDTLSTGTFDSYQWLRDGQPIAGATSQQHIIDAFWGTPGVYQVIVTLNGCTDTSAPESIDGYAFLGLTITATGAFAIDPDFRLIICDSTEFDGADSVWLSVNMPYNTMPQWYRDGIAIPGATSLQLLVKESGEYNVEVAPAACPDFRVMLQDPQVVVLKHPVRPLIVQAGAGLKATPASAYHGYQWYLNGQPLSGATDSVYHPAVSGTYTVSAIDTFCMPLSLPFDYVLTGVDDLLEHELLNFPNPASGVVHVSFSRPFTAGLYTTDGRLVQQLQSADGNIAILPPAPGIYYLQVGTKDRKINRKIVVH